MFTLLQSFSPYLRLPFPAIMADTSPPSPTHKAISPSYSIRLCRKPDEDCFQEKY